MVSVMAFPLQHLVGVSEGVEALVQFSVRPRSDIEAASRVNEVFRMSLSVGPSASGLVCGTLRGLFLRPTPHRFSALARIGKAVIEEILDCDAEA
jgi:hypothetical protein